VGAVDRIASLADADLLEMLAYVRAEAAPPTAADAAAAIGVSKSVARGRLERLVAGGFLAASYGRRSGRSGPGAGRPAKTYAVAPEPDALELPARRYPHLVHLLVQALPGRGRRPQLVSVGRQFGRELARAATLKPAARAATAADRVCSALGRLGFQTSAEVTGRRITFVTPTCPLRPLVVADQAVGDVDRGMWASLVAQALDRTDVDAVECETHACLAGDSVCRITVDLPG
jgi:predicted ArsR family transcriptional regulator